MKTMNDKTQDPLHDYFRSEWEASPPSLSPDFSEIVLKKIMVNRRKERLFNLGCISIALIGVIAIVVFVYPGYQQINTVVTGVSSFVTETIGSLGGVFRIQSESNFISIPMLTYLSLLSAALWSLDGLFRKRREAKMMEEIK